QYKPLCGFLYGWTLFLVIQTGTIAAVSVAFARYLGALVPAISPTGWIIPPINLSAGYAVSLSTQQVIAVLLIVFLTLVNTRGLQVGKLIQNFFSSAKTLSLIALILVGFFFGSAAIFKGNVADLWTPHGFSEVKPDLPVLPPVIATAGALGL